MSSCLSAFPKIFYSVPTLLPHKLLQKHAKIVNKYFAGTDSEYTQHYKINFPRTAFGAYRMMMLLNSGGCWKLTQSEQIFAQCFICDVHRYDFRLLEALTPTRRFGNRDWVNGVMRNSRFRELEWLWSWKYINGFKILIEHKPRGVCSEPLLHWN